MLPGGTEWLIVLLIALLFFGRGKVADLMGEFARGIKSFKKGLADDDEAEKPKSAHEGKTIEHDAAETINVNETASHNEQKAG